MRRSGLAGAVAGLLVAGLCVVPGGAAFAAVDPPIAPMPVTPVSLAQAGEVVQWQRIGTSTPMAEVPASLSGVAVTQVELLGTVGFAVTAAGRLVTWGGSPEGLQKIPDDVAATPVAQVAASEKYAGVVTRAGEVRTWSAIKRTWETPLDVPAGLTGVKQLAFSTERAFALRNDGTVVAWGRGGYSDPGEPPAGLRATALVTDGNTVYALTVDDTVVGWDKDGPVDLPAEVEGSVASVAAAGQGGGVIAMLEDGTLVPWENAHIPVTVQDMDADPVAIVTGGAYFGLVDSDGVIHHWGGNNPESGWVPAGLNGRPIAQLALSARGAGVVVVTKMLRADEPQIGGSAVVGQTLTATPGTFSASPESLTSRWLADGAPIPGASGATLPLTAALVGKAITYESTATKSGETTVTSTSASVTVTKPAPPASPPATKVASKTKVAKVAVAKKAAKVSVTGKVTASKSSVGKAKVTIKKGKKVIVAKTVKVSSKGALMLTVKKFATLVAKKLKAKGKKAKTAYRGKYVITISYAGNGQVKPSTGGKKLNIKK